MSLTIAGATGLCCLVAGCCGLVGCRPEPDYERTGGHSLVEIGEHSLEQGERFENKGDARQANIAYRRALWAFRYHEKLTREEPFLMDEALEGVRRTAR